jgi:hypothetical protein
MSDKVYIGINDKRVQAKGEQLDYILQEQAKAQEEDSLIEAEQTKKDADRASAMAKLSKLGLTDDEIASLIP